MKFVIAPDSFKNSMPAIKVGKCIANGIISVFPKADCEIIPMADGGEGTVKSIITATGGELVNVQVHDPLMRLIDSFYGVLPDKTTAIIEMAAASGIELITSNERNPMLTTSYGTGELIIDAINKGCTSIIVGIGGSATNDGGLGMAQALGYKFRDATGTEVEYGGKALKKVATIDSNNCDKRLQNIDIKVACDVKNTLCGPQGASAVYGPQKGADEQMVKTLDDGLNNLANCISSDLNISVIDIEGGGAAGGLGVGLIAFAGAKLKSGFSLIADIVNLEDKILNADVVISAEGAIDFQTQFGKTPAGVASLAKKYSKPVFVFAGTAQEDASKISTDIIDAIIPITRRPVNLSKAIEYTENWLQQSAKELAIAIKTGINLT